MTATAPPRPPHPSDPVARRELEALVKGRRLAFTSERDGNVEIYVMNAGGAGLRRLTRSRTNESGLAWSPDSRRILFVRDRNHGSRGFQTEIYVVNAGGHDVAWSPGRNK